MSTRTWMSRAKYKSCVTHLDNSYAVISINDFPHEAEDIENVTEPHCDNLCTIVAKDDEKDFSEAQARFIKEFVELNRDKRFIVHCWAGISRSAAVCKWLCEHLDGKLPPNLQNYKIYNKHVYNVLNKPT